MFNVVQPVVAEALRYVQAASLQSDKHGLKNNTNFMKLIGLI
jgi:hypothetical protein